MILTLQGRDFANTSKRTLIKFLRAIRAKAKFSEHFQIGWDKFDTPNFFAGFFVLRQWEKVRFKGMKTGLEIFYLE